MLKAIDTERLEKLKGDIDALRLRFPVATISERTGFNKSTVSMRLNGKIPLSQSFLDCFYAVFKGDLEIAASHNPDVKSIASEVSLDDPLVKDISTLKAVRNILLDIADILKKMDARQEAIQNQIEQYLSGLAEKQIRPDVTTLGVLNTGLPGSCISG